MRATRGIVLAALGFGLVLGCATEEGAATATVRFALDAPLCSSQIPVALLIDGDTIAHDTFRVNLSPDHTVTADYSVAPGLHLIGARVPWGSIWPDTSVTLMAGAVFTDTLPFYCS